MADSNKSYVKPLLFAGGLAWIVYLLVTNIRRDKAIKQLGSTLSESQKQIADLQKKINVAKSTIPAKYLQEGPPQMFPDQMFSSYNSGYVTVQPINIVSNDKVPLSPSGNAPQMI